jgi:hypothetical protein
LLALLRQSSTGNEGGKVNRNGTLLRGLALGALTILGGYLLLIGLAFSVMGIYELISKQQYLESVFLVVMWLVFAGFEFVLARKTIRTLKRWRQQP